MNVKFIPILTSGIHTRQVVKQRRVRPLHRLPQATMKHIILIVILLELELLTVHVLVQAVDAHVFVVEKYFDKIAAHIVANLLWLLGNIIRGSGKSGPDIFANTVAYTREINLASIQTPMEIFAQTKERHVLFGAILIIELEVEIML